MNVWRRFLRASGWIALPLILASSASLSAELLQGQVLEEGTHIPIPGAIVVARWKETRSAIADAWTVCVHVESIATDESGRYTLPRYKGREPSLIDSYKSGYVRSDEYYKAKAYLQHNDILKPFTGAREDRFKYFVRLLEAARCPSAGKSNRNLYPLYNAMHEEARSIAVTEQEREIADGLKERATSILQSTDGERPVMLKP